MIALDLLRKEIATDHQQALDLTVVVPEQEAAVVLRPDTSFRQDITIYSKFTRQSVI